MFADALNDLTIHDGHLVRKYLKKMAFKPSFEFDQVVDLRLVTLMTWSELKTSIPARVRAVLAQLRAEETEVKAAFLDSGNTSNNKKPFRGD